LPVASLALASVLDLGPDGVVRASVFNVALAALDPHVWDAWPQQPPQRRPP